MVLKSSGLGGCRCGNPPPSESVNHMLQITKVKSSYKQQTSRYTPSRSDARLFNQSKKPDFYIILCRNLCAAKFPSTPNFLVHRNLLLVDTRIRNHQGFKIHKSEINKSGFSCQRISLLYKQVSFLVTPSLQSRKQEFIYKRTMDNHIR